MIFYCPAKDDYIIRQTGWTTSYPTSSPTALCRPVLIAQQQFLNTTRDLPGEPCELHIHCIPPETFVRVIRTNQVNLRIITTCRADLPKRHSSCLLQLYLLFQMNVPSEGGSHRCHQCNSWTRATSPVPSYIPK